MKDRLTGRPVPDETIDDQPPADAGDHAGGGAAAADAWAPSGAGEPAGARAVAGGPSAADQAGASGPAGAGARAVAGGPSAADQAGASGPAGAGARAVAGGPSAADQAGASGPADAGASAAPGDDDPGTASEGTAPAPANADADADATDADATRKARRSRSRHSLWRELPLLIVLAIVIALLVKTFVVQAFWIPSGSMENTLEIGDKILVNKLVYHFRSIQPGDIIVFDGAGSWNPVPRPAKPSSDPLVRAYDATISPLIHSLLGVFGTAPGQTDYIKRVIGVPGDTVACCTAQGLVTVNGVPLREQSYLFPGEAPGDAPAGYSGRFRVTVPPGRLWVMGDNRAVSDDSRLRQNDPGHGTIPESAVIGRAFMIVWPPSRWRVLPIPSTFLQHGITASAPAGSWSGTVRAVPAAPLLPFASGVAGAVPLTLLQRRLRLRRQRRRRGRPDSG
jgi:signal peptidase I